MTTLAIEVVRGAGQAELAANLAVKLGEPAIGALAQAGAAAGPAVT